MSTQHEAPPFHDERFQAIVETTPECVELVARDGTLLHMNAAGLTLVETPSPEAVIGRSFFDLVAPEDRERFRAFHQRVLQGERTSLEFSLISLGGARREVESHGAPVRQDDGSVIHLGVTRDVTEQRRAERAAQLLSSIVDSSDDAIISKDLDGTITSWNRGAERLFGYPADEVIGKPVAVLIPPDRMEEEPQILARIRRGERVDHFETVRRRKDGTDFDISLTISPVKDAKGRIVGASKIARDVTDTKRADRAHRLLSAIVSSSDDAIVSKDLNGIITSWNSGAERLFGYTESEAVGRSVTMLIPPDRQDEEPKILARLRRGERVEHFETVRRRKDGTPLQISLTISPIREADGTIIGASKIARDITEQKRLEAVLRASEVRFRQLADSMPQIVWTARPDGFVDYYNERWYALTGLERGKLGDESWMPFVHPEDVERCREAWYAAVRSGGSFQSEYRLWDRTEQRWRWFMSRALPAYDEAGSISKWFGSTTDIDEQKAVEEELRSANSDLEQFAFSASHDLQEPLRTVKIYSELLSRRWQHRLDGHALECLGFLREGATRMEMLVRDLLAYTRVGRLEEPTAPVDAGQALSSTLGALASSIAEAGAQVTADPLPPVRVHEAHLQQLFQNLVGNAIKYRDPSRSPLVHVSAERREEQWTFAVHDNGIGIEPQYKEKVFGLFKRLHSSDEYRGTGIGLALCQRIVDQYRGRIWVESQPGQGSTFRFTLPG